MIIVVLLVALFIAGSTVIVANASDYVGFGVIVVGVTGESVKCKAGVLAEIITGLVLDTFIELCLSVEVAKA